MSETLQQLNHYLDFAFQYGVVWVYVVLFLTCFLENLFPPFPGDSFILLAGALVALGRLSLIPTIVVIIAGGMSSVILLYLFGRHVGRDLFLRKNYRIFSADDVRETEDWLERWGGLVLVSSRFIIGLRSALAVAAGVAHYYAVRMIIYSLISYMVFVGLLIYVAMKLVQHFDIVEQYYRAYSTFVWLVVVILVGAFLWRRIQRFRRRA